MTQYYECHITIKPGTTDKEIIHRAVEHYGWKFSSIDGDPTLGKEVFCYATQHFPMRYKVKYVIGSMNTVADALTNGGFEIVRQKVELIVYDTKGQVL